LLAEELNKAWLARTADVPIEPAMSFQRDGLVLGAGTVLAPIDQDNCGRSICIDGDETRLLTLLSAAYGRAVGGEVLGHLRRGALRWGEGDAALASVHPALTRLGRLAAPREAARRLFMADGLMQAGAEPDMILRALGLDDSGCEQVLKFYNPDQPRVPAGSGRVSGQWTRIGGLLLQTLSRAALEGLARLAARFPAAAVFLGVLFIPTNKTSPEEEYGVPGHPGLRYVRLLGDRTWRIVYQGDDGEDHQVLQQADGLLRDRKGQVVGRVLPDGHVAIDLAAVAPNHVDNDKPRLCPAPTPDNYGQGMDSIARKYEDQVKRVVNPDEPTPSGLAVALRNFMDGGKIVKFDDCEHRTGMMVEAKGPTFTDVWLRSKRSNFGDDIDDELLDQGRRQVQAAGVRTIRWYFADKEAADEAHKLFSKGKNGQSQIQIVVLPYVGKRR
jgi:hypothetical protein